jgi:hypothetical protein
LETDWRKGFVQQRHALVLEDQGAFSQRGKASLNTGQVKPWSKADNMSRDRDGHSRIMQLWGRVAIICRLKISRYATMRRPELPVTVTWQRGAFAASMAGPAMRPIQTRTQEDHPIVVDKAI